MEAKGRAGLSELKVGVFVLISCLILAVAIFTLGTQVGLFEKTFTAKTYLDNVSGLKPGDVVLLGGIEVGNVRRVEIAKELPDTPVNRRTLLRIEELTSSLREAEQLLEAAESQYEGLRDRLRQTTDRLGPDSRQVLELEGEVFQARRELERRRLGLERMRLELESTRANLQNIVVYLELRSDFRDWVRSDSNITLGSIGLLGDRYIEISLGRTDLPPESVIEEQPALFGLRTREQEVVVIAGTEQVGFQELITGANDILANFRILSDKLTDIIVTFDDAEGTVGKFFADPSFYNNLNAAVISARTTAEEAADVIQEITRGTGTVPLLIQDRDLYDKILGTSERMEQVVARIERGEGTLGRLLNDPGLYERSNEMAASLAEITGRMEAGQGTLGKLSSDDRLYQDLQKSVERLAGLLDDVDQGQGTLGRLAKDEELYNNLNQVSSEVIKLLYDFRQDPRKFLTIRFQLF